MINPIVYILVLLGVALASYYVGEFNAKLDNVKLQHELDTTRKVQHNLNCLVGDLRFDVSQLKPDALAYNQCKGLWCTDQPELIKYHPKRERFFRLGYPEHKL